MLKEEAGLGACLARRALPPRPEGRGFPRKLMTPQEILETSVEALESDGRLFEIYDAETEVAEFLEAAASYGLADEARALVERVGS